VENPEFDNQLAVYDQSVAQRVPMLVESCGELYDVEFQFEPLNDDRLLNYFTSESDGENDYAEVFFDQNIIAAEGIEYANVEELRGGISKADKRAAIREGLLAALRLAPPKASGKLNLRKTVERKSYHIESAFNGKEVKTTITLRTPDADHFRVLQALQRGAFPVRFGDHQFNDSVRGLLGLYKALVHGVHGYADGKVPLHHQFLVIGFHLNGYREVILKK